MAELTMPDLAAAMRAVVGGLVEGLDSEQRRRVVFPFDGDMHKRWTYLPGQRPGLRLSDRATSSWNRRWTCCTSSTARAAGPTRSW